MSYEIEHIAEILRYAREAKGLSQRELSAMTGVPQSHISKIEKGAVDLRISSLVEIARVLDLDVTLIPRKAISAVQAIVQSTSGELSDNHVQRRADRELTQLKAVVESLPEHAIPQKEHYQYVRVLRELEHFRLSDADRDMIRHAATAIKKLKANPEAWGAIRRYLQEVQSLRNHIAHGRVEEERDAIRPAYSLDENDHG